MSATAMAGIGYARRSDTQPAVPRGLSAFNEAAHGEGASKDGVNAAIGAIVAYFPTEVNLLYTSILGAIGGSSSTSLAGQWLTFWVMLAAAPVIVWLLYAAKVRADDKPLPLSPKSWPLLEMAFSMVAFVVWAAALPGSPFRELDGYTEALAGVLVLVVTTALGLLAPVFGRKINVPA